MRPEKTNGGRKFTPQLCTGRQGNNFIRTNCQDKKISAGIMEHFASTVAEGKRFLDRPLLKTHKAIEKKEEGKHEKEPTSDNEDESDQA